MGKGLLRLCQTRYFIEYTHDQAFYGFLGVAGELMSEAIGYHRVQRKSSLTQELSEAVDG